MISAPQIKLIKAKRLPERKKQLGENDALKTTRLVVIGNGMAGAKFLEMLEYYQGISTCQVTVFGDESLPAYDRIHLNDFADKPPESLLLLARDWYRENEIQLYTDQKVISIDRKSRTILTDEGHTAAYDILVMATGSRPVIPDIPGTEHPGIFVYRNYEDLRKIYARAQESDHVTVIGGGLLGLESAGFLHRLGKKVMVIEGGSGLMARQLDPKASRILKQAVSSLGISVVTASSIRQIDRNSATGGLTIRCGDSRNGIYNTDMILLATGVRPRDELGRECGINLSARGGFIVDDELRTSDPHIYAIGECASHKNMTYGLAAPGYRMAGVLASNLSSAKNKKQKFSGHPLSTKLKLAGLQVAVFGNFQDNGYNVVYESPGIYRKIIHQKGILTGGIFVGPCDETGILQELIDNQRRVSVRQLSRFRRHGRLTHPFRTGNEDPQNWTSKTIICSCTGTNKGRILEYARSETPASLDDLCRGCGAGSVCGSCRPMVKRLVFPETTKTDEISPNQTEAGNSFPGRIPPLLAVSGLAALLVLAVSLSPSIPVSQSVQNGFMTDEMIRSNAWKQYTGFSVIGLLVMGMVISLKKRLRLFAGIQFRSLRMVHMVLGCAGLVGVGMHTGLSLGSNLNFLLMINFLVMSLLGAFAGMASARFETNQSPQSGVLRRALALSHIIVFWPFPVLLIYHIVMVYYY